MKHIQPSPGAEVSTRWRVSNYVGIPARRQFSLTACVVNIRARVYALLLFVLKFLTTAEEHTYTPPYQGYFRSSIQIGMYPFFGTIAYPQGFLMRWIACEIIQN